MSHLRELQTKISTITNPIFTKLYIEPLSHAQTGLLHGRILTIKDLFDVAGEITTAGSKILADQEPAAHDAPIVKRLRDAGACIIGKTNMSEFAFHGIGTNPHFGDVHNALSPLHISGGSSSGAAVSVAAGLCDIAIGSDTGGSIRLPAALNGIVGFKPSAQRVSKQGAFPLSYTLDSIGPLAKNMHDCILADEVMSGETHSLKPLSLKGLKVIIPKGRMIERASDDVKFAFNHALALLKDQGIKVHEISLEPLLDRIAQLQSPAPLVTIEAASIHKKWFEERAKDYDPPVHARITLGTKVMAMDYITLLQERLKIISQFNALMADYDVMLSPTSLITAPLLSDVKASLDSFLSINATCLHNATIGNYLDICGISLPCPLVKGLPVGLQIAGANGNDSKILAIGMAVEAVFNNAH